MNYKKEFLKKVMVIDTETTSLEPEHAEIIEMGVAFFDGEWEKRGTLYRPSLPIKAETSAVTHIVDEDLVGCKPSDTGVMEDYQSIISDFKSKDSYFVAHNVKYDLGVFNSNYTGIFDEDDKWICTARFARKLLGGDPSVLNMELGYLRYRLKLDVPRDIILHRASSDAFIAAKLLEELVDIAEQRGFIKTDMPYGEQIYEFVNKPIKHTVMPIGKHKGVELEEVPLDYIEWAIQNFDRLDPDHRDYDSDFAHSIVDVYQKMVDK